ncbi:hypothetical protein MMC21_008137 [Puttea exsequens]|nr:hypothetical protein [Puttea exsequens]
MERNSAIVDMLLGIDNVDPDSRDIHRFSPLYRAIMSDESLSMVSNRRSQKTITREDDRWTLGSEPDRILVVKMLLATGRADVNVGGRERQILLILAAMNKSEAIVELLLNTGQVDISAKDPSKETDGLERGKVREN